MLTTKGALLTSGFIKPQADTLWHILINASSARNLDGAPFGFLDGSQTLAG